MYKKTRICECCGKELTYSCSGAYHLAERNHALCKSCAAKKRIKRVANLSVLLNETPESYYWVGFLLADGHFQDGRITLGISSKDKQHLDKFCEYINYTGKIREDKHGNGAYYVAAMDVDVVDQICKKFDIQHDKTYNPPKTILQKNQNLTYALFAGFIDGDGNISNFSKRKDFFLRIKNHSSWEHILNEFGELLIEPKKCKINSAGYAELNITNTLVEKKLKEKFLSLNLPLLSRKWDKIDLRYKSKYEKNKEVKEKIEKLLSEKKPVAQIAKEVGRCETVIYKIKNNLENV